MRTSARTWFSLALFGVGVAVVAVAKPRLMFREDGSMYEFGTGHGKSVFTFGTAVAAIAVLSSFAFAMADVVSPPPPRPDRRLHPGVRTPYAPPVPPVPPVPPPAYSPPVPPPAYSPPQAYHAPAKPLAPPRGGPADPFDLDTPRF